MLGLVARLLGGAVTPLIDQLTASSARLLRKLALFLVAGLSLIVVLIALTIAFDLWVASLAGPIAGAPAVAGLYLATAAIALFLALRRPRRRQEQPTRQKPEEQQAAAAAAEAAGLSAQIDGFVAPLIRILQRLGLRREQLAVLAGTSLAKQVGPVPLVGLAILAGFLIGRMWGGWRALFQSDLVSTLLSTDILASLLGMLRSRPDEPDDEPADEEA